MAGTLAAGFLSDRYGAPLTLMALLVGLALNFLSTDKRLAVGTGFASRHLLRVGIVLVGVRITFDQIWALGPVALAVVVAIVALTIGVGVLAARRLGQDAAFGTLAGGAVAICGASAAMALAATLGERRAGQGQLTLVLVGIAAMSAAAMVVYPLVAHGLGLSDLKAGFLFGASIHDVAQSLGAGYGYSKEAGDIAAIVKLTRVALLAPALAVVTLFLPRGTGSARAEFPWFVLGFFAMAGAQFARPDPAGRGALGGDPGQRLAGGGGHRGRDPFADGAIDEVGRRADAGDLCQHADGVRVGAGRRPHPDRLAAGSRPEFREQPA